MSADLLIAPTPEKSPKTRPIVPKAVTQATRLADAAYRDAMEPGLNPRDKAAFMRAFCELQETRRKLRMKPLPRSIDVSKLPKRGGRGRASAPAGPVEPGPAKITPSEPAAGS